jgi:predicted dehydrogenase
MDSSRPRLAIHKNPSSSRDLEFGLVGLGYWGPNHLRVLQDRDDAGLRWICDRDPQRLERFARRSQNGTRSADGIDPLLSDPQIDAVIVATPIGTHYDLARSCLEAGKHVLVEKPLATTSEQAAELIELAQAKGLALMCGHTFLFSPPVRAVRSLIKAGELGEIYFISSSRVNLGLHQRDASVIWDLGPHDFSILHHWLQEAPESITASGRDSIVRGTPDVAFLTLSYAIGLIANVELSWLAPSKLRRTVVVGSEKMVVYDDGSPEQIRIFDQGVTYKDPETFGEYQLAYRTGDIVSPHLDSYEPIAAQLDAFIKAIHQGAAPPGHLELARNVVSMLQAAERSLTEESAKVPVTRTPKAVVAA